MGVSKVPKIVTSTGSELPARASVFSTTTKRFDTRSSAPSASETRPPKRQSPAPPAQPPTGTPAADEPSGDRHPGDRYPGDRHPGSPSFFDLVGLLAEPASIYLREARSAAPQAAAQSLELARLHIDLLAILQDKTQGNLTPEENAMLRDVAYQLRSGFVGLRG